MDADRRRLARLEGFCRTDRGIARTWSGGQVYYPPPDAAVLRQCVSALADLADAVEAAADRPSGHVESELAVPLAEVAWLCQVYAAAIVQQSAVLEWTSDLPDLVQWSGLWSAELAAADPFGLF